MLYRAKSPVNRTGGKSLRMAGTVMLGSLPPIERYMYLVGPQNRVVVLVDL